MPFRHTGPTYNGRRKSWASWEFQRAVADASHFANIGLNKGEAHYALKNALRIGRQGEIRDRSSEGQHYHIAGLNLLAAIVIHWNTAHLYEAVGQEKHAGVTVEPDVLPTSQPLCGAAPPSPANTVGQNADNGLSVRFCPLPELTCWVYSRTT